MHEYFVIVNKTKSANVYYLYVCDDGKTVWTSHYYRTQEVLGDIEALQNGATFDSLLVDGEYKRPNEINIMPEKSFARELPDAETWNVDELKRNVGYEQQREKILHALKGLPSRIQMDIRNKIDGIIQATKQHEAERVNEFLTSYSNSAIKQ